MEAGCKRDSVGKRVQASNAFSGKAGITDEALMQEYANQGSGAVSSSGGNEAHSFQVPGLKVIDHSFEVRGIPVPTCRACVCVSVCM
jgi:hypothetical protein